MRVLKTITTNERPSGVVHIEVTTTVPDDELPCDDWTWYEIDARAQIIVKWL